MLDMTRQPSTAPLYFVEANFGKLGTEFVATDRLTNSRDNIISNIVSGEWDRPLRVLEVCEDEGRVRDVSEDIAREICDRVANGDPLPTGGVWDFCEEHLGCLHMAELTRETEAA